jgi:hypothetical protein
MDRQMRIIDKNSLWGALNFHAGSWASLKAFSAGIREILGAEVEKGFLTNDPSCRFPLF